MKTYAKTILSIFLCVSVVSWVYLSVNQCRFLGRFLLYQFRYFGIFVLCVWVVFWASFSLGQCYWASFSLFVNHFLHIFFFWYQRRFLGIFFAVRGLFIGNFFHCACVVFGKFFVCIRAFFLCTSAVYLSFCFCMFCKTTSSKSSSRILSWNLESLIVNCFMYSTHLW